MKSIKMFVAQTAKAAAENALKRDANNATCVAIFQPKVPANLNRFKNKQK